MKQSFQDIARHPEAQVDRVEESVHSVSLWLERIRHEWLLVFDGADHKPDEIARFLPPGGRGNIIVTSRNLTMQRLSPKACMEVIDMEEEDACFVASQVCFPRRDR